MAQAKRKQEWVKAAPTVVLERIVNAPMGSGERGQSAEFPLGGLAFVEGIGQVTLASMRAELELRGGVRQC